MTRKIEFCADKLLGDEGAIRLRTREIENLRR